MEGGGVAPAHALLGVWLCRGVPALYLHCCVRVCVRVRAPACSCQFLDAAESRAWPLSGRPEGSWPLGRDGQDVRNTAGLGTPESGRMGG